MEDQQKHSRNRARRDSIVRRVVSAFGGAVLLMLVILIGHLLSQSAPLLQSPTIEKQASFILPPGHKTLAVKDLLEGQVVVSQPAPCELAFLKLEGDVLIEKHRIKRPCEHALSVRKWRADPYMIDISSSAIVRMESIENLDAIDDIGFSYTSKGEADNLPIRRHPRTFSLPLESWPQVTQWDVSFSPAWLVVSMVSEQATVLRWIHQGDPTRVVDQSFDGGEYIVPLPGASLVAKFAENSVEFVNQENEVVSTFGFSHPISWASALPKQRALFTADNENVLTRWTLRNENGVLSFAPTYSLSLEQYGMPVSLVAHPSSNAIALLTDSNTLLLLNRVTGEVVTVLPLSMKIDDITWHGNRLYAYSDGAVHLFNVNNLAGITTYSELLEPQTYEGYPSQEAVWQTSSGSDYQEAKFSLIPLIVGSLKAALLALLIAIPMSVGAAVYTSFFARNRLRNWLKPAIEMLEAIPSVLIGFITAIWLAPLAERFLFSFAFFLVVVPMILLASALIQRKVVDYFPTRARHGSELVISFAIILLLGLVAMSWAPEVVFSLFDIDGFALLESETDSPVGKTTIIVAIALGVAISPSIYSIAEDAINNVPNNLKQASFALGATRLQTLQMVVVRVAMPGILAAIMLGFGRAFGETMILLMVTGNTPIDSWSLLEGLRGLTANLAIELPEAKPDTAHYHILFVTATLLFAFTFVVNTLAEILRQWLRKNAHYD